MTTQILIIFAIAVMSFGLCSEAFAATSDVKPFSILLPETWIQKPNMPFAYANSQIDGNYILIDYVVPQKKFSSRDDFHGYIKSTEYLKSGFGLGNSITTVSTDYGFKSAIELSLTKSDGNTMTMRKDYHYVSDGKKLFEIHGYSSDLGTKSELRKALSTFRPI